MLEDLTINITERQNGAKLTYRYHLEPMGNSGFRHSVSSIIGRLNKVFTRLGYKLNTVGTTCSISIRNGEESTSNTDSENTTT